MGERCCACRKEFAAGDTIITFFFERVLQGEKSNLPGFYPHPNSPEGPDEAERVHFNYSCLEKCFSPADNPFMFDIIAEQVRREILEDEQEFNDDFPIVEFDDDPPYCLWCKRKDTVWLQVRMGGNILTCLACGKLWDDEEHEVVWDATRGIYVDVEDDT